MLHRALAVSAGAVAAILALILAYLTAASAGLLFADAGLWQLDWHPSAGTYGLVAMLVGSVAASLLALLIAVPPGLVLAVWGRFFAPPWVGSLYRGAMGLLASIPSVVYGFWGLVVLVPLLNRWAPPGASLLAAALVLALMILPILVLQADLALDVARRRHLAAAMALGASVSGTVRRVLLPTAAPQLVPAVLLQLGRALGETMAVLMVAGNVVQLPDAITAPIRTLTANIALEMAYASGEHQTALFASGWLLFVLVTLIMMGARALAARLSHGTNAEGVAMRIDTLDHASRSDRLHSRWMGVLAVLTLLVPVLLVGELLVDGLPALSADFLLSAPADAGRGGGIGSVLVSTLWVLGVCLAVVLPLGLGCALFLVEHVRAGSRLERGLQLVLDILGGVPSIVFGLFGNRFFAVELGLGFSILSGGLTLACMVLPLFIRSAEQSLRQCPLGYRQAAAALALSRWGFVRRILLPTAAPGIALGVVLASGRALAETAVLLFTAGYVTRWPESWFDSGRTLAVHIYDLAMNVSGGSTNAAATALVLLGLALAIQGVAVALGRISRGTSR